MSRPIEDYALIGDTHAAALVNRDGTIDWLCLPRFDSPAMFAALLGKPEHGHWTIAPLGRRGTAPRRYRPGSLILETELATDEGSARLIEFMPVRDQEPNLVRIVRGLKGRVRFAMEFVPRFDYGAQVPWFEKITNRVHTIAGPDALVLDSSPHVSIEVSDDKASAQFEVSHGQDVAFVLTWHASHLRPPPRIDPERALVQTQSWWSTWSRQCTYQGPWAEAVQSSLVVLKGLTYAPTGGIVAAATASLPERLGGVRNWDYRYCWVRDATFTLYALLINGYYAEAVAWRDWLLRAVAGSPEQMQITYGVAGERRLPELTVEWLPGYEGSTPVRIGNAAATQFQLDVFGEVMDSFHQARRKGIDPDPLAWRVQRALLDFLESNWMQADEGIWEVRGPRQHFTHSRMMAWVAFDRAVKAVEAHGLDGPADRWRALRAEIHDEICKQGYDPERGAFVQAYGSNALDASLLMAPLVGFLPPSDPRVVGTLAAIERELLHDGLVLRYATGENAVDGLPPGEGAFLPCTFWLADNYVLTGRHDDAETTFAHLLSLRNDVGLLSEEYDPRLRRMVGNVPQAFSHVGLLNTAWNLSRASVSPAQHRQDRHEPSNG